MVFRGFVMNERDFDDGLRQVLVCTYGADCANETQRRHGSATAVYDAIKAARNAAGLNRQLYVVRTSCQGWCEYAPVCTVLPEGKVLRDVAPEGAKNLVKAIVGRDDRSFLDRQIWDFSKSKKDNARDKPK
jgi:(2Fe-2S) ferredoxin